MARMKLPSDKEALCIELAWRSGAACLTLELWPQAQHETTDMVPLQKFEFRSRYLVNSNSFLMIDWGPSAIITAKSLSMR